MLPIKAYAGNSKIDLNSAIKTVSIEDRTSCDLLRCSSNCTVIVYLFTPKSPKLHVTVSGKYSLFFSFILQSSTVSLQYDIILLWIFIFKLFWTSNWLINSNSLILGYVIGFLLTVMMNHSKPPFGVNPPDVSPVSQPSKRLLWQLFRLLCQGIWLVFAAKCLQTSLDIQAPYLAYCTSRVLKCTSRSLNIHPG